MAFKRGSGAKRRKRKPHRRSTTEQPYSPVKVRYVDPAELRRDKRSETR